MKMRIQKGKENSDSKIKLMNDEGKFKIMIDQFLGDLFCINGNATYGL